MVWVFWQCWASALLNLIIERLVGAANSNGPPHSFFVPPSSISSSFPLSFNRLLYSPLQTYFEQHGCSKNPSRELTSTVSGFGVCGMIELINEFSGRSVAIFREKIFELYRNLHMCK